MILSLSAFKDSGIPRGLDEIDLELKSRLAINTDRILNSIRDLVVAGDLDDLMRNKIDKLILKDLTIYYQLDIYQHIHYP